jgi:hypothetical protein
LKNNIWEVAVAKHYSFTAPIHQDPGDAGQGKTFLKVGHRYHHCGLPLATVPENAEYLERFKVFATDHESNPFGIQWMHYLEGCELPELVKTVAHVAFEVDDLEEALRGEKVIIAPNSPSPGVWVAFIEVAGAPVELLTFSTLSKAPGL